MKSVTWSVCATVDEPQEVIRTFIRHYLSLGAAQVCLFAKNVTPDFAEECNAIPSVLCITSQDHLRLHEPCKSHEVRQVLNFQHFLSVHCFTEWAGHVDADEHLSPSRDMQTIGNYFALRQENETAVTFRPVEGVWRKGSDYEAFSFDFFRLPTRANQAEFIATDSPAEHGTHHFGVSNFRFGMTGHLDGKSFFRRGKSFSRMNVHFAEPLEGQKSIVCGHGIMLLHFDAISLDLWRIKLRRRLEGYVYIAGMGNQRIMQLNSFASCKGDAKSELELFEFLYTVDRSQEVAMREAGALLDRL